MKKLMTLLLAASFILGSVCTAAAVEVEVSGQFDFAFGWAKHRDQFSTSQDTRQQTSAGDLGVAPDRGTEDPAFAVQRERIQVNFIASENVQGVLYFEIGDTYWGTGGATGRGSGGALGTDGVAIEVRRAFLDFNVPNTELLFRVGLMGVALPSKVVGSPILDDDAAGILATYPVNDMINLAAFWYRPFDQNVAVGTNADTSNNRLTQSLNDEMDLLGFFMDVNIDGMMSFSPYVMYGIAGTDLYLGGAARRTLGTNALNTARATRDNALTDNDYQYMWWVGGAFEFTMLDPLTFALDVVWGSSYDPSQDYLTREGWYVAGRVDYQTPYVTPGLVGWWTSGDDDNIYNGSERMPVIGGTFATTSFGYDGNSVLVGGDALNKEGGVGTWGVMLQFADISFIEDLTHTLRVAFIGGTNDTESMRDYRDGTLWAPILRNPSQIMLTTADYAWEINFDHRYQIYESLAAIVEMGMIDVQRQAYPWRTQENRIDSGVYNANELQLWETSTAWKLALGLQYKF